MAIRQLYLVRHGDAVPEFQHPERPLSTEGVAQIERIGTVLKDVARDVEVIFHSSKKRTEQTAEILAETIKPASGVRWRAGLNPEDPIEPFFEELEAEEFGVVMLAGHLPFLPALASWLLSGKQKPQLIGFGLGAVASLHRSGQAEPWTLLWMLDPQIVNDAQ